MKKFLFLLIQCVMLNLLISCNSEHNVSTEKTKVIEKQANGMIDFKLYSYSSAMSAWTGVPITCNLQNENAEFELITNVSYLYSYNDNEKIGNNINVKTNELFIWHAYGENHTLITIDAYVDVIARIDNKIVGFASIFIYNEKNLGLSFKPYLLESVVFPKVDGEYQDISIEYVQDKLEEAKLQKDYIPEF